MRSGSGRVGSGGDGDGGNGKNSKKMLPPPAVGVHPRYVPRRGAVLKGIVRGMVRCFLLISTPIGGPVVSSGSGRRVRPAPAGAGGDAAEQGK